MSLRIAFASIEPADAPDAFSGSTARLVAALRRAGAEVLPLGPLERRPGALDRLRARWQPRLFARVHHVQHCRSVATAYARVLSERLAGLRADLVLARSSEPVGEFAPALPLALWTDACFPQVLHAYPGFQGLTRDLRNYRAQAERALFGRCLRACFTSRWAADHARTRLGLDPSRACVLPIGANRDPRLDEAALEARLRDKPFDALRLLFIGVEWHRKGGDRFLRLLAALRARGLPAEGLIVGCWPPASQILPDYVRAFGSLPHSDPESTPRLEALFARSHFLVLPTRVDCSPVVVPEAYARGLPVVATPVGGLPEMVRPDETGQLGDFDTTDGLAALAAWMHEVFLERERWSRLARAAARLQAGHFNWDRHARLLLEELERAMAAGRNSS